VYGGARAIVVNYGATCIGFNLETFEQTASNKSAFYVGNLSRCELWYGVTINGNTSVSNDGLFVGLGSSLTINYTNCEIKDVRYGIQSQWNGNIFAGGTSGLKLTNCSTGIFVEDNSKVNLEVAPTFSNVTKEYHQALNELMGDNSLIRIFGGHVKESGWQGATADRPSLLASAYGKP
jgi:hypothetical protein